MGARQEVKIQSLDDYALSLYSWNMPERDPWWEAETYWLSGSEVKVTLDKYENNFVSTIEIKLFSVIDQILHIFGPLREWTLLIFKITVQMSILKVPCEHDKDQSIQLIMNWLPLFICLSSYIYIMFVTGVLVANKTDLDQRRVISPKAGMEFAESNGLKYFECSAVSLSYIHSKT